MFFDHSGIHVEIDKDLIKKPQMLNSLQTFTKPID